MTEEKESLLEKVGSIADEVAKMVADAD